MDKKIIIYTVSWTIILSAFWLLLSGYFTPLLLSFGAVSVFLVLIVIRRMDVTDSQLQIPSANIPLFTYFIWLAGQILLSSLKVTKHIWLGGKALSPATGKLNIRAIPAQTRVLYTNSITLTPGTLSIDIDESEITVHALDETSIALLQQNEMADKVVATTGSSD